MSWGVDASQRTICGVVSRVDISCCEDCVVIFQQLVNSPEDSVGFSVSASACPPAFDDSVVIPKYLDSWELMTLENSSDE